jgi:predicted dehydrogenase
MPLHVGIVGWGEIAKVHAAKVKKAGAQVSAIVEDPKIKLDIDIPVYHSIDDMLPHVDAVTIAVPNFLHASFCLKVVRAGKPVYVEKPFCITKEELDELEKVISKQKATVHVGYRLRWNPTVINIRERIKGVRKISCMYNLPMKTLDENKGWTLQYEKTGGGFFTLGVHSFDIARWIAGARGEALTNFSAHAEGIEGSCDFPLHVQLSGTLPSGIEIVAGADHRSGTPPGVEINIEADVGGNTYSILPPHLFDDEDIEFEGIIRNFISSAEQSAWNRDEFSEIIQTHRELLEARRIASIPK